MELSIENLAGEAQRRGLRISDIVIELQAEQSGRGAGDIFSEMELKYRIMKEAVARGIESDAKSQTGLSGGDARRLERYISSERGLGGALTARIVRNAIAVSEVNASMGKIVAAPTAGSCGIIPGLLSVIEEETKPAMDKVVMALITAGGFGAVVAEKASVSGAEGGCQAECGTAAAMAAAAGCELLGGTPDECAHAFALGLVCDPVGGYVEYPCVYRNASGAVSALAAAEMALAGIKSIIPPDEVIMAMKDVGARMDSSLKETALAGLAATPTARRLCGCKGKENLSSEK